MSCPMVTWCMAGSLPTPTGMHRSRTSRRGCMEMAPQESVFGSAVFQKPRTNLIGNYWCKVVPNTGAFRTFA